MSIANPTPEEIEEMRAAVAAADAAAAQARAAEEEARLAPMRDFVTSAAFVEVRNQARTLAPTMRDDETIYVHLRPLSDFMDRLANVLRVE